MPFAWQNVILAHTRQLCIVMEHAVPERHKSAIGFNLQNT
jgi:hypothetical protein